MSHIVFISYSSKERNVADAVLASLEKNDLKCWLAPRDIHVGQMWASAIGEAISGCRVLVLLLSSKSAASKDVAREVNQADTDKKIILPFWIEDVPAAGPLDYYLRNTYRVDARGPGFEAHLPALVDAVKQCLQAEPLPVPQVQPVAQPLPPTVANATPPWPPKPRPHLSLGRNIARASIAAAVLGGLFGVFGIYGCVACMLLGPLLAILWASIVGVKSHSQGHIFRTVLGAALVFVVIIASAGATSMLTIYISEAIRQRTLSPQIDTPASRPATGATTSS